MERVARTTLLALAVMLLLALSFVGGRIAGKKAAYAGIKPEVDTIYRHDTIRANLPVYTRVYVRDTIRLAVRDTIRQNDTLFVELPREVREYKDSTYYARVVGYHPELEYIETYNTEKVITATIVQEKKLRPRFSAGVQVGYGIPIVIASEVRPAPYIGIGIQANLISWDFK